MSVEIRWFFVRKHISYVTTFIIIWSFYLASQYYQLFEQSLNENAQSMTIEKTILIIS